MKKILMAAVAALSLTTGISAANAETLTFSDLTDGCYGSGFGCTMLPNMTFDGTNLTYTSGNYVLSFSGGSAAHIADGSSVSQTYNWHDGPANSVASAVSLARIDGTAFNLAGFDYSSDAGLTVAATGFASLILLPGSGTAAPAFNNVRSVSFSGFGFANQLDNIVLNAAAVPEPATWGMMILGFGMIGAASRSRKVKTTVKFA